MLPISNRNRFQSVLVLVLTEPGRVCSKLAFKTPEYHEEGIKEVTVSL